MHGDLVAMAVFALIGAITPGPVNLLALRYGLDGGLARPLGYVVGASSSYGMLVWLAGMGAGLLLAHPGMAQLIQWVGAAYLAWLAWRIATAPFHGGDGGDGAASPVSPGAWRALMDGGVLQVLNPKAWIVAVSGVALFVSAESGGKPALVKFCVISVIGCAAGGAVWAAAGGLLKERYARPQRQRLVNRLLGALLGITVIAMLF
ncbi:LysE family translocator [Pseudoduganella sp. UC29_106]|uniref:LysE family translocator n=1 Tax=Pseudoduganella sp. UC29_106 TaxID=3374553 RepID=UPI0037564E1B